MALPIPAGGYRTFRDHLSEDEWHDLLRSGAPVRYEPGDVLLNEGDDGDHVLVLLSGACQIVGARLDQGRALLAVRWAGDVIGEQADLDQQPRSASAYALSKCSVRLLRGAEFAAFIRRRRLDRQLTRYVSAKLRSNSSMVAELAGLSVKSKVAWLLCRLAVSDEVHSFVPLSQRELADLLGLSRSSVAASLADFRATGLLRTEQHGVQVLAISALLAEIGPTDTR
ncbi:Crp/Fnr family transcriptional regulator [Saccharopolyspora gloriosae]|uniref:Crp/Fnr family transcriptional regulator n=1 Tax=Saccharopolyspora gloriosae TaxID=455344 RepID=UPI001FB854CA|nr:Crp/Fnr family transcriptional regulator [Saccharopolyspora gloriosae]